MHDMMPPATDPPPTPPAGFEWVMMGIAMLVTVFVLGLVFCG